jgi:hypothetical protein
VRRKEVVRVGDTNQDAASMRRPSIALVGAVALLHARRGAATTPAPTVTPAPTTTPVDWLCSSSDWTYYAGGDGAAWTWDSSVCSAQDTSTTYGLVALPFPTYTYTDFALTTTMNIASGTGAGVCFHGLTWSATDLYGLHYYAGLDVTAATVTFGKMDGTGAYIELDSAAFTSVSVCALRDARAVRFAVPVVDARVHSCHSRCGHLLCRRPGACSDA